MKSQGPYKPKRRRDSQVTGLFWRGVYYGAIVGLPLGLVVWGFLLLGGAPLMSTAGRATASVAASGLFGAVVVCVWVWGKDGLQLAAPGLAEAVARRVEWIVWPFVSGHDEDERFEVVTQISRSMVLGIAGFPAGIPVMAMLAFAGRSRPIAPLILHAFSLLAACGWVALAVIGWRWMVPPPATAQTQQASTVQQSQINLQTQARQAALDSSLQLAVARAKRLKDEGHKQKAIETLERALQDAARHGRSIAHVGVHWTLGWLYAEQGNVDGAIVMFQTVLDLTEPETEKHQEARAALDRLSERVGPDRPVASQINKLLEEDAAARGQQQTP